MAASDAAKTFVQSAIVISGRPDPYNLPSHWSTDEVLGQQEGSTVRPVAVDRLDLGTGKCLSAKSEEEIYCNISYDCLMQSFPIAKFHKLSKSAFWEYLDSH